MAVGEKEVGTMFLRRMMECRNAAGDGDGGGGDGGGAPRGLTEEDVGKVIGPMVNGAVTNHLKKALPAAMADALAGLKLDEKIAEAMKLATTKAPDDGGGSGGGKKKTELEAQFAELAGKLEAAEKRALDAERARQDTEAKRQQDAALAAFRAAVAPKVRPELLDVAVSHWATVEGRLKVGEDGTPTVRVRRAPYKGAPEVDEDVPMAEALPVLLAAPEAKPFLPAPAAPPPRGGAPAGRGAFTAPGGNGAAPMDDQARAQAVLEGLARAGLDFDEVLG